MASKADKKRNHRAQRGIACLGAGGAGRPQQEGERYPSGKLKPRKNERLIEAKRALVGEGLDIALADDPLDFIHAKGWLTTARYRMALSYRDARRRACLGSPGIAAASLPETESTTGIDARSLREMSDADVTAVFDHVFQAAPEASPDERQAKALKRWKALEAAMTSDQRREVSLICIDKSWAFWMTELNMGRELVGRRLVTKHAFEDGLDAMRRALKPSMQQLANAVLDRYESMPQLSASKVEHAVQYVDEEGAPVALASEKGRLFEVARMLRVTRPK